MLVKSNLEEVMWNLVKTQDDFTRDLFRVENWRTIEFFNELIVVNLHVRDRGNSGV